MQRTVERMLRTSPEPPFAPADPLSACIHACVECAQACTACADACVAAHDRALGRCIRINLDCADLCTAAARLLSRQLEPDLAVVSMTLQVCAAAYPAMGQAARERVQADFVWEHNLPLVHGLLQTDSITLQERH